MSEKMVILQKMVLFRICFDFYLPLDTKLYSWPAKGRPRPKVPNLWGVYMLQTILQSTEN